MKRIARYTQQAARRIEGHGLNSNRATSAPLNLFGKSYLLPTLTISRSNGQLIDPVGNSVKNESFLQARAQKTPIVLDLHLVSSDGSPHARPIKLLELRSQIDKLNNAGFVPVGITNASEDVKKLGLSLRLPYFINTRMNGAVDHEEPDEDWEYSAMKDSSECQDDKLSSSIESEPESTSALNSSQEPAMVIEGSVRSGQQIYSQGRSLIVLGSVNSGAEVLSDGDIHVFGALKGRALAGIGGNAQARIFAHSFDAELVSIADHFTTCDALLEDKSTRVIPNRPTWIQVENDQLSFKCIK